MNRWTTLGIVTAIIIIGAIALLVVPGKRAQAPSPEEWVTTRGNADIIRNVSVRPGQTVLSPLKITGEARGGWFFEADFPVVLTNWDGLIIAMAPATAVLDPQDPDSTWMTEEYVPFEATLEFETPPAADPAANRGSLILQKHNASGLPEHDDALEIPVVFE